MKNNFGIAVLALVVAQQAGAADWSTDGRLLLGVEASDNVQLGFSKETEEEATQFNETLRVGAERDGRNFDVRLQVDAEFVQYSGTKLLKEEDNQRVSLTSSYQGSANLSSGLNASYNRDTYSGSVQLLDAGGAVLPPGINPNDAFLAREQVRADVLRLSPYVNWALTPRLSIGAEAVYSDAAYDDQTVQNLFDYDDAEVALNVSYGLSKQRDDAILLRIARTDFSSDFANGDNDSVRYPIELIYSAHISETLRYSLSAGVVRTEFDAIPMRGNIAAVESRDDTSPTFEATLTSVGKLSQFHLGLRQYVRPGSTGRVTETKEARVTYSRDLSATTLFRFNALYVDNSELRNDGSVNDSDYLTLEPKFSWKINREALLSLRYSYKQRDQTNQDNEATANVVAIDFEYQLWD